MTRRVLIADDNRGVRETLQAILEDEGYEVATAANGRQALERIAARRPDLVLLDLQMPVMSGWEVNAVLHEQQANIPVVFMSAGFDAREEAAVHDADGYLDKPFEFEDLLAAVRRFAGPAAA